MMMIGGITILLIFGGAEATLHSRFESNAGGRLPQGRKTNKPLFINRLFFSDECDRSFALDWRWASIHGRNV